MHIGSAIRSRTQDRALVYRGGPAATHGKRAIPLRSVSHQLNAPSRCTWRKKRGRRICSASYSSPTSDCATGGSVESRDHYLWERQVGFVRTVATPTLGIFPVCSSSGARDPGSWPAMLLALCSSLACRMPSVRGQDHNRLVRLSTSGSSCSPKKKLDAQLLLQHNCAPTRVPCEMFR